MTGSTDPVPGEPGRDGKVGRRLAGLSARQRRRLYLRAVFRPTLTAVLLVVIYFALPLDHHHDDFPWALLAGGLILMVLVLAWQIRMILRSNYPLLQGVEALAAVVPLYILSFASTYVALEAQNPASFTQPMSHMAGLYFSVVVFGTVGFGDIAPVSDPARALVTVQILGDLAFIAAGLRLLAAMVRQGQERVGSEVGEK
jgi:hypothetical protein